MCEFVNILSHFSENLNDLILDQKITPKILADRTGIDRSAVYKYLRKEILPTLPNLIVICDFFHCSADFILGLSETNPETAYKQAPPFCERFRDILAENHMSRYRFRKETALKKLHFAKQSVDDWYHGKRFPSVFNVINIAAFFRCSLDHLLGRE